MTHHRVAVVGLGHIGWLADQDEGRPQPRSHVSAWRTCPRADLVVVCDADPARAQATGKALGLPWSASILAPLLEYRPDIVSLATPPATHAALIELLCEAAAPPRLIVCEKPLALSSKAAQEAVEACQRADIVLLVNHGRRFHPLIRGVKQELDEGRIGKLLWASAWTSGGLWNNQVHMVDLLRFFLGEIRWVHATWRGPCGAEGEDGLVMTLRFADGVYALIHAGDIRHYVQMDLHLFGERGSLGLRQYGLGAIWYGVDDHYPLAGGYRRLVLDESPELASPTTFLGEMAKHACNILEGAAKPWCTGEDGLAAVRVLEAAERSGATGSMAILPGA